GGRPGHPLVELGVALLLDVDQRLDVGRADPAHDDVAEVDAVRRCRAHGTTAAQDGRDRRASSGPSTSWTVAARGLDPSGDGSVAVSPRVGGGGSPAGASRSVGAWGAAVARLDPGSRAAVVVEAEAVGADVVAQVDRPEVTRSVR